MERNREEVDTLLLLGNALVEVECGSKGARTMFAPLFTYKKIGGITYPTDTSRPPLI